MFLIFLCLSFAGCGVREDITYCSRPGFEPWGGRRVRLRVDIEIQNYKESADFTAYAYRVRKPVSIPRTLADYTQDFEAHQGWSTLPAGTVLRINRLIFISNIEDARYIPYATIESGPLAGKTVAVYGFEDWKTSYESGYPVIPKPECFEVLDKIPSTPSAK